MRIWTETYDLAKDGYIVLQDKTEIIKIDCFWRNEGDSGLSHRVCNFIMKQE